MKNLKIIKFMGQLPFRYIQPESISKTKGWSNALPSIYLYYTVQVLKSTKHRAIYSTPTPWTSTPTPGVGEPRKHQFCNFFSSGLIHLGGLGALHDWTELFICSLETGTIFTHRPSNQQWRKRHRWCQECTPGLSTQDRSRTHSAHNHNHNFSLSEIISEKYR